MSDIFYQYKFAHGVPWLKIFHHDRERGLFTKDNVYRNKEPGLYSALGAVNDEFRINGSYEFLYEIPKYNVSTSYNRWRQQLFPSNQVQISGENVTGFEPIHISFDHVDSQITTKYVPFTGLAVSNMQEFTLFDGTSEASQWFFAIGLFKDSIYKADKIPGYSWETEVILWVRIPWSMYKSRIKNVSAFKILISSLLFLSFN